MKKILLPTDFSDCAGIAIQYAIKLFGLENVDYYLLNTYVEPFSSADILVSVKDILHEQSQQKLEEQQKALFDIFPKNIFNLHALSEYGDFTRVVKEVVKQERIDVIVMGTTGAGGLKKLFYGSNTANIIKKRICPVIAVPLETEMAAPEEIALALEENQEFNNDIQLLSKLLNRHHADLTCVNVASADDERQGDKYKETINKPYQATSLVIEKNKSVIDGLVQYIEHEEVDLLAMISKPHHFIENLLHKSRTQQMVMLSKVPVLVLPEHVQPTKT